MASDACITLAAIFFTRILGRVQFTKIQRAYKTQKENRGLTDESPDSKSGHLFPAAFSPCSIHQDTKDPAFSHSYV
ncbi:hypothetical protein [Streptococcus pantholopis]